MSYKICPSSVTDIKENIKICKKLVSGLEKREKDIKTVDFTANKNNQSYAIEVTRLGLAKSNEKQPIYDHKVSTLNYDKNCEDADGFEVRLPPKEGLNVGRIETEIYDVVDHKYRQFSDFLNNISSIM